MSDSTKAGQLAPDAAEARRAYKRAWYAKNKERVKAYNLNYWERRAAEHRAEIERQEAEQKQQKNKKRGK